MAITRSTARATSSRAAARPQAYARVRPDARHAPRDEQRVLVLRLQLHELVELLRQPELGLDVGLLAGRADERLVALRAEQETDRLREDRLARTGLAGDRVQPGRELELGLPDEHEVLDSESTKHGVIVERAPDGEEGAFGPRLVALRDGRCRGSGRRTSSPAASRAGCAARRGRSRSRRSGAISPTRWPSMRTATDVRRPLRRVRSAPARDDERAGVERVRRDERHRHRVEAARRAQGRRSRGCTRSSRTGSSRSSRRTRRCRAPRPPIAQLSSIMRPSVALVATTSFTATGAFPFRLRPRGRRSTTAYSPARTRSRSPRAAPARSTRGSRRGRS